MIHCPYCAGEISDAYVGAALVAAPSPETHEHRFTLLGGEGVVNRCSDCQAVMLDDGTVVELIPQESPKP